MKLKKLIELLQQVQGNPEVAIWNGFAQGHMPLQAKDLFNFDREYKDSKEAIKVRVEMDLYHKKR
jgi:hypothetical protein